MAAVSLAPAPLDVAGVRAGDRNTVTLTITQDGAPLNLTGATLTSQVRAKATDPDPPALTAVVAIVDGPAGKATIQWKGSDVAALLAGVATWAGVWDLQVASASLGTYPVTVCAGKWAAEIDVTRP